jgi:SPP1 gp7 family putative phage head morphogenesis protein
MKELLVKTIPQGWHEKLRDQLLMGNANGEPVAKIAQRVQGVYEGLGDYSARRVAQTEIVGGYNNGAFAGMVAAGVERKQWISTLDNRVRDSHALMFGEIARVDMPFSNGLQHPGGEGPASEVIGCRCCVVAYYGEEAKQPTVATEPVGEPTMPALPNPPN